MFWTCGHSCRKMDRWVPRLTLETTSYEMSFSFTKIQQRSERSFFFFNCKVNLDSRLQNCSWALAQSFLLHVSCVFCSAGLLSLPEWWAAPVREGESVCGSSPVGAAGGAFDTAAFHAALLGRRGPRESWEQSSLWSVTAFRWFRAEWIFTNWTNSVFCMEKKLLFVLCQTANGVTEV